MLLEDDKGYPLTASAPFGWVALVCIGSSGLGAILLGLFLALWIYTKGRTWSLVLFLMSALCSGGLFAMHHWHIAGQLVRALTTSDGIIFLVATFVLRFEIIHHYREREGWEVEIGHG